MKMIDQKAKFYHGLAIPKIGFGTWQSKPGDETYNAVRYALKHGYRHIDTAAAYKNEESVGKALKDSQLKRENVFITTKLPAEIKTYEGALEAFENSLKALDTDYVDLYLMHAPWPWHDMGKDYKDGNVEAYRAMEKVYREGKAKAIGVSNFNPDDLDNILTRCDIVPHANQIAYFIGLDQADTIQACRKHNILVEAYSPLGIGYLLENETIQSMAKTYDVTPAQLCIRWCIQKDTLPLPKTVRESRVIENKAVDFEIKEADMKVLDAIKGDPRCF